MQSKAEKTIRQKIILAKVVLAAAERLGLTGDQLASTLNIDSVTPLSNLEFDPATKQGELALTLIRIANSLDTLTGGDIVWIQHFMKSPNKLTTGIPIEQIQNHQGLTTILLLLEGLQNNS